MPETLPTLFDASPVNDRIRLRTLIMLRWAAIVGQTVAIGAAQRLFSIDIELGLCAFVIGASIVLNLISIFIYPENKRLDEREATWMLLFDTVQVGLLLGLTGGLHNPFAILILAPVTVAATALSRYSAILIGAAAVLIVSLLGVFHLPLRTQTGLLLQIPELFLFGFWLAMVVAVAFMGSYTHQVSSEMQSMSQALLATQMALAREQKLTDLGGVVAAAAHELGTPLATIKLVSSEMIEDLKDDQANCIDLREDARLIGEQTDRCRDILRSMGRMGKDDLQLRQAPLSAVIEEAAEPHRARGKAIAIAAGDAEALPGDQPIILRRPELVHGLRNLIQNAVDFASTSVWVELCWGEDEIMIKIIDDGAGYPPHLLGRIGDPFIRKRPAKRDELRPEYEGMGLGLFIAKTLLERTGAELVFANGTTPYTGTARPGEKSGAIVKVTWPRINGGIEAEERMPVLGENQQFES